MASPVVVESDVHLEVAEKEPVQSPTKPKKLQLKEVPPAHKKIGHLKVDKDGEVLYKKTPSSMLMLSLQLGIQQAVGSLEPKPKRDLLMTDFEVVDVTDFPSSGSEFTPAHKHKEFRFKTYSPVAFRFFREAFQIKPEDYMVSLCHYSLSELSNPGASGSLFYRSADDEFIMKTVSKKEAEFLQKLLPGYYLNLTQNKRTLLPKFFGLYNYQSGGKNIRVTAMNNLLPSTIEYHEKYDLKGSSYKRFASSSEQAKKHPTFKDIDFQQRHPEGITLAADIYDQLMSSVKRDVTVLKSFGIMDYSLLVGIHNIDEALRQKDDDVPSSPKAATLPLLTLNAPTDSPFQRSLTVRRMFSIIPESAQAQTPNFSVEEATSSPPYEVPPGGLLGRTHTGDRVIIFLGIIDILQSYRFRKKLEHTFKSVITDGDTVSVHKPGFYMKRFYDFISTKVFKKEPKAKPKTRRSFSRPPGTRRQASLSSDDAATVRPQLPRQRSVTTPERDAAATYRQSSPPTSMDDPPPDYTEKPTQSRSGDHLISVPRLSSVDESHEPLSPPVVIMTTTLEASTSNVTEISNQESVTSVHVEVDTNVANQASSSVQSGEDTATGTDQEVLTETMETAISQTNTTLVDMATEINNTSTVDTGTANEEAQHSVEVTVHMEKTDQRATTKSFTIQATPHRNVNLSNKEQEIDARLTATL